MDYETIVLNNPICESSQPRIDLNLDACWDQGEIVEIKLPIVGGFTDGKSLLSIKDYVMDNKDSCYIKMDLIDHFGNIINTQKHYSDNLDFYEDNLLVAYYEVDLELSTKIRPGSYQLYVYLVNTQPDGQSEKLTLNTLLTDSGGIDVTVF